MAVILYGKRIALLRDVGGTLRCEVPEGGPSSATVSIYDENGAITSIDASAATVTGQTLSVSVGAGIVDQVGQYRARWIYTADGATRYRDQLFYVARALFDAPCGEESFLAQYPILRDRMPRKVANATAFLDRAWGEIESRLRAKNLDPFRIVDPGPFEPVQAAYAAAFLAENLSAAATEADEWGSKAIAWMRYADAAFDRVLANLDWYDEDQDMLPGADEQRVRSRVLALR